MNELNFALAVPAELSPEGLSIRMAGDADAPLFCLADVAAVMGLEQVSRVADRLDQDEVTQGKVTDSMGREQTALFVTEAGLYLALLRSDKPQARPFRRWVCREVLPCIRKHGCYPAPADAASPFRAIRLLLDQAERHERRIAAAERMAREADAQARAALATAQHNLGHYSVVGWTRLRGLEVSLAAASKHGKKLTAICEGLGVEVGRVADPRFGYVHTYPESVLRDYFAQMEA